MNPTREQVIAWALEAGDDWDHTLESDKNILECFAALAYAAGRDAGLERAAELCDKYKENVVWTAADAGLVGAVKTECAAAIRALKVEKK